MFETVQLPPLRCCSHGGLGPEDTVFFGYWQLELVKWTIEELCQKPNELPLFPAFHRRGLLSPKRATGKVCRIALWAARFALSAAIVMYLPRAAGSNFLARSVRYEPFVWLGGCESRER